MDIVDELRIKYPSGTNLDDQRERAAKQIERLRGELNFANALLDSSQRKLRYSDRVNLKPLLKVNPSDCPSTEVYGAPVCWSGNTMWPWPTEETILCVVS